MLKTLNTIQLAADLKREAARLGFVLVGITPAVSPTAAVERLQSWLAAGFGGEMRYIHDRLEAYADPNRVLDGARSIVMLALPYRTDEPQPTKPGEGRVARYAWGEADYHDVIHERMKSLISWIKTQAPAAEARGVVDSAPVMEREFAQLAGLGWIGKNTLLLNRQWGSWFFLAALLTDLELPSDEPMATDHCGTCTACLDACPTNAFPQPYVLDATRCISYLTIEQRGSVSDELRSQIGDWVFGCDVCQDVCPWNRRAPQTEEASFLPLPTSNPLQLIELFRMTDDDFRRLYRRTPLWRPKRRGLLRNAAIVLGNQRCKEALTVLETYATDEDEVVRDACTWAIERIKAT